MKYKLKKIIICGLYLSVNSLFVYKYSMRLCDVPFLVTLAYIVAGLALLLLATEKFRHVKRPILWTSLLGTAALTFGLLLQYRIDPYSLQVDRWSAIHYWIQNLFQGIYPYSANTHLGGYGSPFPVWQLLHIPFYLLGNVALSTFCIFILWVYTIFKTQSRTIALTAMVLLIATPAFWYEIITRSDLMANLMLSCTVCHWLSYKKASLASCTMAIGIISGLFLSTRLIAVIPLATLYGYEFLKLDWRRQCLFVFMTLITFILTFLPFALWKGSSLFTFQYSPLILQTRQGNLLIMILWSAFAIGWVYAFRNQKELFDYSSAIILFALMAMSCVKAIIQIPGNIFTDSTFDITYFSTLLPFAVIYIANCNLVFRKGAQAPAKAG